MLTYDVTLCIGTDNPDKRISVKCHDTGINFRVYLALLRRSKWREIHDPYDIPPGSTAVLKIAKPDKTYVVTDGVVESDDIVFAPPPQSFTAAGTASAEVALFGPDGRRVTTATFYIDVSQECVCDCAEESATYVDVMAEQIKAAVDAESKSKEYAESAGDAARRAEEAATRAENLLSSGGGGSGISVAVDGKTLILKDGVMRVNTANAAEQDNTLPITSAGVYKELGNINALLATI